MVDISDLPEDLVRSILHKLPLPDLVRSAAVCKSWQSIYRDHPFPGDHPWLILGHDDDPEAHTRGFFSLSDHQTRRLDLPEATGKRCLGATLGWILTVGPDLNIHLLHPFSRTQIPLPPPPQHLLERLLQEFTHTEELLDNLIFKAFLTSDPRTTPGAADCVVVALFGKWGSLAFCRLQDEAWTLDSGSESLGWYCDIMYYKDQIYVITNIGRVFACDITPELEMTPTSFALKLSPREVETYSYSYLVCSGEDLLLVLRYHSDRLGEDEGGRVVTRRFQVFKLDSDSENWSEVKSIGNRALFLGLNYSLSVSAQAFPGCTGNSIYFTDDCVDKYMSYGYEDVGIYHLEDGSIESFFPGNEFHLARSPSVWLISQYNM